MNIHRPTTLECSAGLPHDESDDLVPDSLKSPLTRNFLRRTSRPERHNSARFRRVDATGGATAPARNYAVSVSRSRSLFENDSSGVGSPKFDASASTPPPMMHPMKPAKTSVRQLTDIYAQVQRNRDTTPHPLRPIKPPRLKDCGQLLSVVEEDAYASIEDAGSRPADLELLHRTEACRTLNRSHDSIKTTPPRKAEAIYQVPTRDKSPRGQNPSHQQNNNNRTSAPRLTEHGVLLDTTGYAIPSRVVTSDLTNKTSTFHKNQKMEPLKGRFYRPSARSKGRVERAYSVLRPKLSLNSVDNSTSPVLSPDDDDSDNDVDIEKHHEKVNHVSRIRKLWEQSKPGERSLLRSFSLSVVTERSPSRLFNYALVVTLVRNGRSVLVPDVLFDYPPQKRTDLEKISQFCFPDSKYWQSKPFPKTEYYTFVLTDEYGTRQYGHCCRIQLSDGEKKPHRPEVVCLVSDSKANELHMKVFREYTDRRLGTNSMIPEPKSPLKTISLSVSGNVSCSLQSIKHLIRVTYSKHQEELAGNTVEEKKIGLQFEKPNFDLLLNKLSIDQVIRIFASLLLERRIIFISKSLSTLSSCLHAMVCLLYPFEWPHTYAPLLPEALIDMCCAPTPFVVGVMIHNRDALQALPLDDVLIIDIDNKAFIQAVGDEHSIIPKKLRKALKSSLVEDTSDDDVSSTASVCTRDQDVFEGFLRLFVETIGHYKDFVTVNTSSSSLTTSAATELPVFQNKAFIKAVKSKTIGLFLEWFTETQMFQIFINSYMDNNMTIDDEDEFNQHIIEYQNEMKILQTSVRHNMKKLSKKIRNFVIGSGGKIKKVYKNVFI